MTLFLLARHGQSEWNAQRLLQGQANPPLTELGQQQASSLKTLIEGLQVDRVICSDLLRARQTTELLGYSDPETNDAWREIDVGSWCGVNIDQLKTQCLNDYFDWRAGSFTPAGGETWKNFHQRIDNAIEAVGSDAGTVLVITHGGCIRAMLSILLKIKPIMLSPPFPGSLTVVENGPARRLRAYNLVAKLTSFDSPD